MKCLLLFLAVSTLLCSSPSWARHTIAVGGFGGGNFSLTDTTPDLDIGPGGGVSFEYRFNQRWGLQTSLSFFSHDGEGASRGDTGILVLNVPTVDLKFYMRKQEGRVDPYLRAGLGVGVVTEGSRNNNSGGAGMTAQVGIGSDFYFNDWFSLGIDNQFRTFGIFRGSSQSSALMFFTTVGNFTFHFK